ncbi:MAG TPA: hypothetical protein VKB34_21180 [Povalibacter sp.]|nr:hypothetical protein [Povalibacter sp.]
MDPVIRAHHLAAILTLLALAGCGAARSQESQAVDLGAEVTLAPGATAAVKAAGMKVRFVAVTEDSRCPRDTTCVWAGEVKVQIEIQQSSHSAPPVEMLEGGTTQAGGYRVTLVRVEPQPVSTTRIAPQEYRATLRVDNDVGQPPR